MAPNARADDVLAITDLIVHSHWLVDAGEWARLVDEVFAEEVDGVVPEADFGFERWVGRAGIAAGYDGALPRFEAAVHAVTNVHVDLDGDRAAVRSYVQGWHWVRNPAIAEGTPRPADFMVLGVMRDDVVRQRAGWRIARRHLARVGPDVAVGGLPTFLAGLGEA